MLHIFQEKPVGEMQEPDICLQPRFNKLEGTWEIYGWA